MKPILTQFLPHATGYYYDDRRDTLEEWSCMEWHKVENNLGNAVPMIWKNMGMSCMLLAGSGSGWGSESG